MYCVIQKVVNKRPDPNGASKEIIVESERSFLAGVSRTKYTYRYSDEKFERPIRDAYKVSIHKSYREDGKVKKRQWAICTIGHYEMVDVFLEDLIREKLTRRKTKEMGAAKKDVLSMILAKLYPIQGKINATFMSSEESRVRREHNTIVLNHHREKRLFEEKYGYGTYDFCYDVFGKLRKPECLEFLNEALKYRKDYENGSYQNQRNSNHNASALITYSDEKKVMLKKIYRSLAKTFHPDITHDDGKMMELILELKKNWGI